MPNRGFHLVLNDGTRVLVRPIRPDDKGRLQEGLKLLSPRSRFLRFHAVVDRLTDEQLSYLTEVDQHDHAALVALDEDRPDHPGIGVARYIRLEDERDVAEAAVAVVDEYQGRGLGTALLGILGRTALDNGVRTFRNYVLAENEAMLGLLDEIGATRRPGVEGVEYVDVPIVADPDELPETPAGHILRAVAGGRLRMLVSGLVPVRIEQAPSVPTRDTRPTSPLLRSWLDSEMGE